MRAQWAAVGLSCAALASAAEPAPPAKPAPAAEDTITAAKRDLEAIKAMRGPGAESGRSELPRLAAPELTTTPSAPAASPARAAAGSLPKGASGSPGMKSTNWLVDAMAKKGERMPGEITAPGAEAAPDERESENPLAAAARPRREAERDRDPARHDDKSGSVATPNPLAAYMASWMTPQDYQLLRPSSPSGAPASGGPDRTTAFLPDGAGTAVAPVRGLPTSGPAGASNGAPRENPFLAALGPVAPAAMAAPTVPPPGPASVAAAKPPVLASPPPAAPVPATPPAFTKPLDDAKYFKPLKKF